MFKVLKKKKVLLCGTCIWGRIPSTASISVYYFPSRGHHQPCGVSGSHQKKKSCLGPHIKYIVMSHHKKSHNVLSKFKILCWATFTTILGRMRPTGHGLDIMGRWWRINDLVIETGEQPLTLQLPPRALFSEALGRPPGSRTQWTCCPPMHFVSVLDLKWRVSWYS